MGVIVPFRLGGERSKHGVYPWSARKRRHPVTSRRTSPFSPFSSHFSDLCTACFLRNMHMNGRLLCPTLDGCANDVVATDYLFLCLFSFFFFLFFKKNYFLSFFFPIFLFWFILYHIFSYKTLKLHEIN